MLPREPSTAGILLRWFWAPTGSDPAREPSKMTITLPSMPSAPLLRRQGGHSTPTPKPFPALDKTQPKPKPKPNPGGRQCPPPHHNTGQRTIHRGGPHLLGTPVLQTTFDCFPLLGSDSPPPPSGGDVKTGTEPKKILPAQTCLHKNAPAWRDTGHALDSWQDVHWKWGQKEEPLK